MIESPSMEVLDKALEQETASGLPLHAQLRLALKFAIDRHFEDGQQFWTETALIERLGLSQITVRRALQDLSREGLILRRRAVGTFVCKQNMANASSIGVFVPAYDSSHIARGLEIWSRSLRPSQRRLHVYPTHQGESCEEILAQIQGTPETEGIILFGTSPSGTAELHAGLCTKGFRVVTVDCWAPGLPGPHIGVDNAGGIEMGLCHLAQLGHERVLLINSEPEDVESVVQRRAAFEKLTRSLGIDGRQCSCGFRFWDCPKIQVEEQLTELWQGSWHPTAIMTVSDPGAWAVLRWAFRMGIRVPDELSVMGFDDDRPSRDMQPALTSTAQPLEAIAARALEILDSRETAGYEQLAPTLIVRESTAPVPRVVQMERTFHAGRLAVPAA